MKLWMAPGGLHVEPGTVRDARDLARLHAGAFYRGWPEAEFSAYITDPERTPAYVAMDAKHRVAGFAMLRLAGDEVELLTIVVDPKWQGRGVGRALLVATFTDLLMSPVTKMFLEVEDANAAAIALYRSLGFMEVSRREGYYRKADGAAATALVMRRDLD
jgi:ribosomal-protein-alanine N-acetyltransferase